MDWLKTTRVLVLDDEMDEAALFMRALAQHGIGSVHFTGREDELPSTKDKLSGIRLAAIDMDLDGAGGDVAVVISSLFRKIDQLICAENGPYLAVAWTKHDDYAVSFQERKSELACPPIKVIHMKKADYGDISAIFSKTNEAIADSYPLGLLGFWEQSVHQSSNSAVGILPKTSDWITRSRDTFRLLLNSAANRRDSAAVKLGSILSALNSLQLDAIETIVANQDDETAEILVSPLTTGPSPTDEHLKATLNYRLMCSNGAPGIAPGNVYSFDAFGSLPTGFLPTPELLISDAAKPGDASYREELKSAGCIPIAMEVTPLCDYQQRARGIPRFVCGLAVPMDSRDLLKGRALFLRATEPIGFEVPGIVGNHILLWNSHFVISVPRELVNGGDSLVRLRQAPLVDVQAWLGSQGNRPGYLSIRIP